MADLPPNQVRRSARTGNLLPSHLRLVKGLWRRSGPCCHSLYVAVQHEWRRCASVAGPRRSGKGDGSRLVDRELDRWLARSLWHGGDCRRIDCGLSLLAAERVALIPRAPSSNRPNVAPYGRPSPPWPERRYRRRQRGPPPPRPPRPSSGRGCRSSPISPFPTQVRSTEKSGAHWKVRKNRAIGSHTHEYCGRSIAHYL